MYQIQGISAVMKEKTPSILYLSYIITRVQAPAIIKIAYVCCAPRGEASKHVHSQAYQNSQVFSER